jgi:hypothetical protein
MWSIKMDTVVVFLVQDSFFCQFERLEKSPKIIWETTGFFSWSLLRETTNTQYFFAFFSYALVVLYNIYIHIL